MADKKRRSAKGKEELVKEEAPKKLVPNTVVASKAHQDLTKHQSKPFEPFKGEYHLVSLDADGNEKIGTDFSVGESTYYRTYHKLIGKSFALKKNPR